MVNVHRILANSFPKGLVQEKRTGSRFLKHVTWNNVGLGAWKIQSIFAFPIVIGLVATNSFLVAALIALTWSWSMTIVYYLARRKGMTDIFELCQNQNSTGLKMRTGLQVFMTGPEASAYAKLATRCMENRRENWRKRAFSLLVRGVGMTYCGVTANYHVLSHSGKTGRSLLALLLLGSCLHVTYQLLFSSAVKETALRLFQLN